MNIWNGRLSRLTAITTVLVLALSLGVSNLALAQDGKALFEGNCASCHKPHEDMTGPALKGAQGRWKKAGVADRIYDWVQNSQGVVNEGVPYAKQLFADWNNSVMTPNALSVEEIDAIFAYVEAYEPPAMAAGGPGGPVNDEGGTSVVWYIILLSIIVVIAVAASGIRRQLLVAVAARDEDDEPEDDALEASWKRWIAKYWQYVAVLALILFVCGTVDSFYMLREVGVYQGYKPDQPIDFPHDLHAGEDNLAINCEYCHHNARIGKHAGIPSTNVCMNCHKTVAQGPTGDTSQIAQIYLATGWDQNTQQYTGATQPIRWNKVHNLPDHVFFSHAQHVAVGQLQCQECHGPVEEMKVAEQFAPLTMKWCLDCHNEKEVNIMGDDASGYYEEIHTRLLENNPDLLKEYREDGVITVRELGGWECAKCHY